MRECNRYSAQVGDTVAVVVTIENRGWLPIAWVLVEDLLPRACLDFDPPSLRVTGRRLQLAMFRVAAAQTLLYQLQCNRRGYYQIGPLVLETGDLFGLHRRYRVATTPHFLLVYPQVVPLEGYEIASRRPIGEVRMTYRLFEDPTRKAGVRPYEAGDPLNRIHWRATARTGVLHSKIYEPSTVAGATIVARLSSRLATPRKDEPYRSELAITAAASLANARLSNGPASRPGDQRPRRGRPHPPAKAGTSTCARRRPAQQAAAHARPERPAPARGGRNPARRRAIDADSGRPWPGPS